MAAGRIIGGLVSADASSANADWGGQAVLAGMVSVAGVPARRRVSLYEANSGAMVKQVWSDDAGHYRFNGLAAWRRYQVVVSDYPAYTYADKAALQTPGNWTLNIDLDNQPGSLSVAAGLYGYSGRQNTGTAEVGRANAMAANAHFGGSGVVVGRVLLSGVPAKRRVRLHEQASGIQLAAMWTDDAGYFAFVGVSTWRKYSVMAGDFPDYAQADAILANVSATAATASIYSDNRPLRQGLSKADCQHLRPTWGGGSDPGIIAGTVKIGLTPSRRKVRLYDHGSGYFIQEAWCGADGRYEFKGLSKKFRYTVTATDYPDYAYNDTIACNLTPV